MKFPSASDIASTNVVSIKGEESISSAVEEMVSNNHRDIVVLENNEYYILTALEMLWVKQSNLTLSDPISTLTLNKIPTVTKDVNVLHLLQYLDEATEYICVVNKDKSIYGIITHTDITGNIDPEIIMDHYTLEYFLKLTRRVRWIDENVITNDVLIQMHENGYDSAIIVKDERPFGILTTKDVVYLIKNNSDLSLPVKVYMNSPVDVVSQKTSIRTALEFVKEKHYKRLIVVDDDDGRLIGVITQKELIDLTYNRWALLMREHQEELQEINTILKAQNKAYELMASTDSLTGLYNRHKFKDFFISSLKMMLERDGVMSLVMMDMDYFKKVNDTYGHNVGDDVLKGIASILKNGIREIDIACRWGGEEFVLLFPTVDIQQAYKIAEKLRLEIQNKHIPTVGNVTASFGITSIYDETSIEDAIHKADNALYHAKSSGRNCVMS